ncbi:cytochrome b [Psychromonas sp. B3M02]|uniref:cytochrome b n=1 Tax=Psychromonas sp. B3M02 TaxID=2267226 RepID=UPI000DEB31FC|nr:cytochrome b [Psychromonas sp. B3M02]RBW47563.1 cytochrome b [Psychromonas sp. B3M02]
MATLITKYHGLSRFFHWISAIIVIGLFAAGYWMVDLSYYSEWYKTAPHWHKSVGLCFVAFTTARLIWKLLSTAPAMEGSAFEKKAASAAHILIYILLFTMFLSGYLISTADGRGIDVFDWFEVPGLGSFIEDQADYAGLVHEYVAYTLIGLASLHALAALKHHFINKDNTLKKML